MIAEIQEDTVLQAKTIHIQGFFSHEDFKNWMTNTLPHHHLWIIRTEKAKFISISDLEWLCKDASPYPQKIAVVLPKEFFPKNKIEHLNTEANANVRFFGHLLEARAWLFGYVKPNHE
jgi:hypothetical protein